jgi:hypothetical protein
MDNTIKGIQAVKIVNWKRCARDRNSWKSDVEQAGCIAPQRSTCSVIAVIDHSWRIGFPLPARPASNASLHNYLVNHRVPFNVTRMFIWVK